LKFQHQHFVQNVDSKEDLLLGMKENYIKENVIFEEKKLFLSIVLIKIFLFMNQMYGGVIIGIL
jgi:hypothetical protein